ncbi:MAG: hypothetical protein J6P81_01540, partial [Spirochaetales bacterium]|nr:hypothetical protein [Spirochaetales bacterium]
MHYVRKAVLIAVLFFAFIIPAFCAPASEVRFGVLKGPTGIGACQLLSLNEEGKTRNKYSVTLLSEATDMIAQIAAGQLDIAAIP